MHSASRGRRARAHPSVATRLALLVVAAAVTVAGCGAAATPAPTPTPTPTLAPSPSPTPTPTPTATPAPSPTPTSAPDPAGTLKISPPYAIQRMDPALEATFQEQMTGALGAMSSLLTVGGRELTQGGALKAYVVVMAFPASFATVPTFETSMWAGVEASLGSGKLTTKSIDGVTVRIASKDNTSIGMYLDGASVVMVIPVKASDLVPITTALLKARG